MSRNSLASKMSPHNSHSTNSVSSSRETIRTRGCLQEVLSTIPVSMLFSGRVCRTERALWHCYSETPQRAGAAVLAVDSVCGRAGCQEERSLVRHGVDAHVACLIDRDAGDLRRIELRQPDIRRPDGLGVGRVSVL